MITQSEQPLALNLKRNYIIYQVSLAPSLPPEQIFAYATPDNLEMRSDLQFCKKVKINVVSKGQKNDIHVKSIQYFQRFFEFYKAVLGYSLEAEAFMFCVFQFQENLMPDASTKSFKTTISSNIH